MWVGHSSTEENTRVCRFAQMLKALRLCIHRLRSYYEEISAVPVPSVAHSITHPHFYPYPTSFAENGKVVHFQYIEMLEDPATCVTYRARITGEVDSPDIVVKFVTRYGTEVHKFLADHKHAPRLRSYCLLSPSNTMISEQSPESPAQSLSGQSLDSMQMVVDYVSVCKDTPADAREQIKAVLDKLHFAGYVLFDEDNKVKFIDFDWSGCYDMNDLNNHLSVDLQKKIDDNKKNVRPVGHYACYPLNLSKSILWAEDVEGA